MTNVTFTWEILAVDEHSGTMTVRYKTSTSAATTNIAIPNESVTLESHIVKYAPLSQLVATKVSQTSVPLQTVSVGASGTSTATLPDASTTVEIMNNRIDASVLRAQIVSVMAEMLAK